jgi:hypothetical protein
LFGRRTKIKLESGAARQKLLDLYFLDYSKKRKRLEWSGWRSAIPEFFARSRQTARHAGLAGLKNGDLLIAAAKATFDVSPPSR